MSWFTSYKSHLAPDFYEYLTKESGATAFCQWHATFIPGLLDKTVMKQQCRRLLEVMERPGTTIQILPLEKYYLKGMYGNFMVMDSAEGALARCEAILGNVQVDDAPTVSRLRQMFTQLDDDALGREQTQAFLRALA